MNDLDNVDFIPSNVQSSHPEALLYVFEDNEAVIKTIIKGRSPTMRHVSKNPQSCSWLIIWPNQSGLQDPNQIHWHQEPNSQTYWQSETSHVMNGIICWICSTSAISVPSWSWSDVEKNARRCRWRKSHSKIKADDEFGLTIQREGSERACLSCIGKPGENQIWKSESTSELVKRAASKNGETCDWR